MEFLYPLIQAYDSVELKADVELGGNDQKFNLVLTRHIQRAYGLEPQVLFLMPLLRGTDGNEKMSKSLGNAIGINDDPADMYGKVMSISDELIGEYFNFTSGFAISEINDHFKTDDPYKLKHMLAKTIVSRYHDESAAENAASEFLGRFRDKSLPSASELIEAGSIVKAEEETQWMPRLISEAGAAKSNGEARRLINAGAVSIDGEKFREGEGNNLDIKVTKPTIIKVGKRRFFLVYTDEDQLKDLR